MNLPSPLDSLEEACQQRGADFEIVDPHSKSLVRVSKGQKHFFASNGGIQYPLNSAFATSLARDKAWCSMLLKQKGYRVIPGEHFFLDSAYRDQRLPGKEWEDALIHAKGKYPVFVKPNRHCHGLLAEIIYDEPSLEKHLNAIAQVDWIALIQDVVKQPEYRIFAIDGVVQFSYRRWTPEVVGDGKSAVKTLVEAAQSMGVKIQLNEGLLVQQGVDLNTILAAGKRIQISSKSNLSAGGSILDYSEVSSSKTHKWVKKLTEDLSLRICGIDLFSSSGLKDPDDFTVIEVNSCPGLNGIYQMGHQKKVVEIWSLIMQKYFDA